MAPVLPGVVANFKEIRWFLGFLTPFLLYHRQKNSLCTLNPVAQARPRSKNAQLAFEVGIPLNSATLSGMGVEYLVNPIRDPLRIENTERFEARVILKI